MSGQGASIIIERDGLARKGNKMRYEFQVTKTVVIDSKDLNVGNEEEAREMLANGWGKYDTDNVQTVLVHVGHGEDK